MEDKANIMCFIYVLCFRSGATAKHASQLRLRIVCASPRALRSVLFRLFVLLRLVPCAACVPAVVPVLCRCVSASCAVLFVYVQGGPTPPSQCSVNERFHLDHGRVL